ncbi:hypothetical protein EVAR_45320_1 [Eumeta japonica]|uniref:Uncharacterized protein n=1 Tax=Eumeta variegata TaxID=151549 RepID=A0A4C1XMQ6_EUMVA|nr:hypothetical protein EVAR_45320_1 [Eumeta japonica]
MANLTDVDESRAWQEINEGGVDAVEMQSLRSMRDRCRNSERAACREPLAKRNHYERDIFNEVQKVFTSFGLPWSKLVGVCTDGVPSIVGYVGRLCGGYLKDLNLNLQRQGQLVNDLYKHLKAFQNKMRLWETQTLSDETFNAVPAAVYTTTFNKGVFKKRVYSFLKGRQRLVTPLVLSTSMGGGDRRLSWGSHARFPS